MKEVKIANLSLSNNRPFVLIGGLNVLETDEINEKIIKQCKEVTKKLDIDFIFKASYDKANRSSVNSYRGPGLKDGLKKLSNLKTEFNVPVISDIHLPSEAEIAAEVLDVIQIPAFLCRQTDLLKAACETGLPLNIKKGQFLAPSDVNNILEKCKHFQNEQLLICERGTSFGYNNLVVDILGMLELKKYNYPLVFDVTHSLQMPGGLGDKTAGRREFALNLAKAGISLGISALFLEMHPNPEEAKCDGPCALHLEDLEDFLNSVKSIDSIVKDAN
tara:strand:- start:10013 stop:10837 length:825 start_codon:yes stop_codon:yes gene_type:complete